MSAIQDANNNLRETTSIFTNLAQAIGNTQYDGGTFEGRMKSVAKTMAVVNKIGYATIPLYFRVKNQVETTLLAAGKLSKALQGQNGGPGILGKSLGALSKQYQKAKDVFGPDFSRTLRTAQDRMRPAQYDTSVSPRTNKQKAMGALDYLSFGLATKSSKLGSSLVRFIKMENKGRVLNEKLNKIGAKANKKVIGYYTKIKGIPVRRIMLTLGRFLLFGLKMFIMLSLGIAALVILLKSKTIQTFAKKVLDVLIEVGLFVFNAIKGIIDGFILIYRGLTGKQGIMKSIGMVLLGIGKILFGVFKILFGVAFIFLKGMFSALLGGLKVLGEYIVEGLQKKIAIGKAAGKMALSVMIPGMARGGISPGGLTLVGEEGPELVRLPTGARVYSNPQSKRMATGATNNITVNVQGRIGASDTELRQIASKIGQMINKEVNRTTSSRGTLG